MSEKGDQRHDPNIGPRGTGLRVVPVKNPDGTDSGIAIGMGGADGDSWPSEAHREAFEALTQIVAESAAGQEGSGVGETREQGPNVKRLIVHKMSVDMVPAGCGLASALAAMTKPGGIEEHARAATAWVEAAIAMVKAAPGNRHGDDDEAIAGEILRGIEAKKEANRSRSR